MSCINCPQKKCAFNRANGGETSCPECAECGASSNVINENCVSCWNCMGDEGFLRQGLPKKIKEQIKQILQEREQEKLEEEQVMENE